MTQGLHLISPSYREMDVEKGAAICHGNVGRGRNGAEQRRPRKSPKPRDPRERGTPPPPVRVGSAEALSGDKLQQDRLSQMMGTRR